MYMCHYKSWIYIYIYIYVQYHIISIVSCQLLVHLHLSTSQPPNHATEALHAVAPSARGGDTPCDASRHCTTPYFATPYHTRLGETLNDTNMIVPHHTTIPYCIMKDYNSTPRCTSSHSTLLYGTTSMAGRKQRGSLRDSCNARASSWS